MKQILLSLTIVFYSVCCPGQNLDSLFFSHHDTTDLAKSIAEDERNWRWSDTLLYADFEEIDSFAQTFTKRYSSIPDLAKDLTAPYQKEEEKVRAIFIWMVANIAYDEVELEKNKKTKGRYEVKVSARDSKEEIIKKYQDHYYRYATKVLKNKRGICEGYSTLFYELCKASGINCDMVWGYADNDVKVVETYKKRNMCYAVHAWNKVQINGQWAYIDVTWASKSIYNGKRYEANYYNPKYYLIAEDRLYETHIEDKNISIKRNELVGNY